MKDEFVILLVAFVKGGPIVDPDEEPVGVIVIEYFPILLNFNFEHKMAMDVQRYQTLIKLILTPIHWIFKILKYGRFYS
jgi:hypothetical protein